MQLCSFVRDGRPHAAVRDGDDLVDLTALAGRVDPSAPDTVLSWIALGDAAVARIDALLAQRSDAEVVADVSEEQLVAPIPRLPYSVLALAANYNAHLEEALAAFEQRGGDRSKFKVSPYPCYFTKDPRTICGPFDEIAVDAGYSTSVDWEVELAVVIGKEGRDIAVDDALDHVFGYSTFNDVSIRDVQTQRCQIWKGKNQYRSSPFGPYIVTRDAVGDPQDLALQCWVNGELMQSSRTSDMTFSVAEIIADLSTGFVLSPGDVIATGTCTGTGNSRNPQIFLTPGDVLESELEGLGRQRNPIVALGA